MNTFFKSKLNALALLLCLVALPMQTLADDIDIFVGTSGGTSGNANVLIVLDNTTNWNRQSQHWPGQITQAQAEINAIKTVVSSLDSTVNVGLMMMTDNGSGNSGGYIRSAVKQMTDANKTAFVALLDTMYNNYKDYGTSSNMNYGNVLFDVFKYFGGYTSPTHATDGIAGSPTDKTHFGNTVFNDLTSSSKADVAGYTSSGFTAYTSPISTTCSDSYIIFIGNGKPNDDEPTWLTNVGGDKTSISTPNYTTTTTRTFSDLGLTSACYSKISLCSTADFAATCSDGTYEACACSSTSTSSAGCSGGKLKYMVQGVNSTTTATATGTYSPTTTPGILADEWVRFLYQTDVNSQSGQQNIYTYTIDVYNAQQDADQTALLQNMARVGGGKYYAAKSESSLTEALKDIFSEIQSVNSTFASASLPVNATNRSQSENQVFIGMFRPDPKANPRWFGNMKRYQLVESGGAIQLGDIDGNLAINPLTGFITNCAASWWTSDSGTYWKDIVVNPNPAGACTTSGYDKYSDAPDGPQVEKGAVAEVIRKGNNPPATNTTATYAVNRTIYTESSNALTAFNTTSSGLSSALVDFISGKDVNDEKGTGAITTTRPSLHGDVIHSRPLPINYGDAGVVAYYGANDGTFRAVEASTGKEKWAFIAPEFFSRLSRLKDNSPLVSYPPTPDAGSTAKDYFFDGSIGAYQNADNSKIWIFPTMRRGGRMIYAINVTDPDLPSLKWKAGCPNLSNDTGCTTGMTAIGQTWSVPRVGFIKGFSTTTPVIVVGGGYDSCEDADDISPSCSSPKGGIIYVLNADTGEKLASFATSRSVAADVSFVDIDGDTYVDYAYAADTGGGIYRIDFINSPITRTVLDKDHWVSRKVAYTDSDGKKFLFAPAVLANSGKVYIAIGSGDREHPLETQYPYNGVTNRFYVYLDDLATTSGSINIDSTTNMEDFTTATTCDTASILPTSNKKGWFMKLNQNGKGEQTVTSALIAGGLVAFSTNRPIPAVEGSCSTSLGEARGYWVSLFNASGAIGVSGSCGGARSSTFVGGGLPPSPVLTTGVQVGKKRVTVVIGAVQKDAVSVANAPIGTQKVTPSITSKRKRIYSTTPVDN